jgi:hypothetical protein
MDYDILLPVFPKLNSVASEYKLSDVGWHKAAIKRWCNNVLCYVLYNVQTPYIYLDRQDLEYYSKTYKSYFSFDDALEPCQDQLPKSILFVEMPHCGDLAWCIRQTKDFDEKDNLLKLLDASYEVQKLVRSVDEHITKSCHLVHARTQINSLIKTLYRKTFTQYTFENYRNNVQEIFFQAVVSYSVTIIKNLILLVLMSNQHVHAYLQYACYGIIGIAMMIDIEKLGAVGDLNVYGSHFITACLIATIHANILHDMYYYQKIVSIYWIIHASFFLGMLCYKYDNFKKVMNEYENYNKVIALLNEERSRDKKIILL